LKISFWIFFVVLFLLHHDFWWWDSSYLVFGFLPIGMAWHVLFSILVSIFWVIAVKCYWPAEIENWVERTASHSGKGPSDGL
jgi:hypothetical protein